MSIDSRKMNKDFSRQVKMLSGESGIYEYVAANVIRWKKSIKASKKARWYGLSDDQLTSPSVRLADKVRYGTNANSKFTDDAFLSSDCNHEMNWLHSSVGNGDQNIYHDTRNSILMTEGQARDLFYKQAMESSIIERMMEEE